MIRTVEGEAATTSLMELKFWNCGLLKLGSSMRSRLNLTSSAVSASPLWNLTPSWSSNSQVVGSIVFQLLARRPTIWPEAGSRASSVSKMFRYTL
jgi:hypothetical protein